MNPTPPIAPEPNGVILNAKPCEGSLARAMVVALTSFFALLTVVVLLAWANQEPAMAQDGANSAAPDSNGEAQCARLP